MIEPRADLSGLKPYAAPQFDVTYRLNTNESPYPPPPAVIEGIARGLADLSLNRYPDRDAKALVERLAARSGRHPTWLWPGNGSNEVILHLLLAFGGAGRKALVFEPTYPMHPGIARIAATEVLTGNRDPDLEIDLDDAVRSIEQEKPDVVFCCSPNNPTGQVESIGTIKALCEESDGIVIVDEAYGEFTGDRGATALLDDHPNLVIVRTMSKAWGLAGARIGYGIAAPEIVDVVRSVRLPYHLSALAQLAANVAMDHDREAGQTVEAIIDQRDQISLELGAMGLKVWPSRANFVLFEVDEPQLVWERLLDREILIRSYADRPGLTGCLRVTAGTAEETAAFLAAMRDIIEGSDG